MSAVELYCKGCETKKPGSEFWARRGGKQYLCKVCLAAANKDQRDRKRRLVFEYLAQHPCVDCGEADPVVLDFDHVRGSKAGNVSHMISASLSMTTIMEEILKCEVRCANCHRRKTCVQMGYYAWAEGKGCRDAG